VGERLQGKVALITGAGSGLGRASARLFADEGASIVIAEIDPDRARDTEQLIKNAGGKALTVITDVSQETDVKQAIAAAIAEYGRLDVLFSNAGVITPMDVSLEDVEAGAFSRILDVNLKSVFYGCKHAARPMRDIGGGSIVVTSSAAALAAYPGTAAYAASKGGINALVRVAATDLGKWNIRVNAICPTGGGSPNFLLGSEAPVVDEEELRRDWDPSTSQGPLIRPVPPRLLDHAKVALFLACEESSYLTGLAIPTDGGTLSRVPIAQFLGSPK
jgi:NAD(P)-dependent dehydrogenase (short-subunit alcohol dehydrogenase family)